MLAGLLRPAGAANPETALHRLGSGGVCQTCPKPGLGELATYPFLRFCCWAGASGLVLGRESTGGWMDGWMDG